MCWQSLATEGKMSLKITSFLFQCERMIPTHVLLWCFEEDVPLVPGTLPIINPHPSWGDLGIVTLQEPITSIWAGSKLCQFKSWCISSLLSQLPASGLRCEVSDFSLQQQLSCLPPSAPLLQPSWSTPSGIISQINPSSVSCLHHGVLS